MNCLSANELPKTSQKQDIGTPATLDCFRASTFFRNTLYTPVLGGRLAADGGTVQTPGWTSIFAKVQQFWMAVGCHCQEIEGLPET